MSDDRFLPLQLHFLLHLRVYKSPVPRQQVQERLRIGMRGDCGQHRQKPVRSGKATAYGRPKLKHGRQLDVNPQKKGPQRILHRLYAHPCPRHRLLGYPAPPL
jgi:hypothetical protein